jgi:hypothetical protein
MIRDLDRFSILGNTNQIWLFRIWKVFATRFRANRDAREPFLFGKRGHQLLDACKAL